MSNYKQVICAIDRWSWHTASMICVHARHSQLEKMGASALSHLVIAQMGQIERLELLVAKLRREHYGPKSEKAPINAEQLMLGISGCVIDAQPAAQSEHPPTTKDKPAGAQRKSRALPAHLRREVRTHLPEHSRCPCCNGELRKLARMHRRCWSTCRRASNVIRHVRPKMSCRTCSCVVQAPAPERVIDRGLPGPGLL